MSIKKPITAIRLFFLRIIFRALRAAITRKWLDDGVAKDMMTAVGVHPGIVQSPDLIFAKSVSQLDQKTELSKAAKDNTVIYTCLTNGYDDLSPPIYRDPNCDYILFTDNRNLQVEGWTTRFLDNPLGLDARRLSRWPKILPHRFFPDYSISIYVDANLIILGDLTQLTSLVDDKAMALFSHSDERKCIFEEAKSVIELQKDIPAVVNRQMEKYKSEDFPKDFGLHECGLMVRNHYDPLLVECMESWWSELLNHSHRDQLSFSYARWKEGLDVNTIAGNVRYNNFVSQKAHSK